MKTINFTRKFSEDAYTELCNVLQSDRFVAIIDLTWGGWIKVHYYFIRALNFIFVPRLNPRNFFAYLGHLGQKKTTGNRPDNKSCYYFHSMGPFTN